MLRGSGTRGCAQVGLGKGAKGPAGDWVWGGEAGGAQPRTHRFCSLEGKRDISWHHHLRDTIKTPCQAPHLSDPQLTSPLPASSEGGPASRRACWPAGPPPPPPETQAQSFRASPGLGAGARRGAPQPRDLQDTDGDTDGAARRALSTPF